MECFHPVVRQWFTEAFAGPTTVQQLAWPVIAQGQNTLLLAPTGSGKTLAAFLVAIDRIMFPRGASAFEDAPPGVHTLYISPLKALGVDVQRNLRAPLAGVCAVAQRQQLVHRTPTVGVRSGDTPADERVRLRRKPPDILITTPESLYLMLTSSARESLLHVDTVIVDEIHSMVASKRGAHLFVSLERLEMLRQQRGTCTRTLQRIGLSATQRPLDEVARLLGGADGGDDSHKSLVPRPVQIIEAGRGKQLDIRIEVPVEDMSRLAEVGRAADSFDGTARSTAGASEVVAIPSIWPAMHPRLVELIRAHRSTMVFVNSRRLAERLATAINELSGEELALAHHGSIARDMRLSIEDRLKRGQLRAIVATSSLELGIDMGAVDLVIQIEAPPSIAAGIQRIGRAGHQVGAPSTGVIIPKYRGDLLACSAAAERMARGEVEASFYPRNPLDVLAQQLVAMVSLEPVAVDELYAVIRRAAPFHDLTRSAFENVLDLLSGRYPSDEFSELRPRVTWDRVGGIVSPRDGTQKLAVVNAGTIPDRGLYGVFLLDDTGRGSRVGELDEEMVYETHAGDVFLLGASSWRVLEITNDRVIVAPAPGEPGRMPFWRGDGPGRPLEFGQAIGALTRRLMGMPREQAEQLLCQEHALAPQAARNLMDYLDDQAQATGEVPSDKSIVVEQFLDEVGDWRVALLTPFGARVHAPWAAAVSGRLQHEAAGEVDVMWTDDGIMFRLPESTGVPSYETFFPRSDEIRDMIVQQLSTTAVFAARFRENAARALLLPRRHAGRRQPLWLQRRRSADLLSVAARYPDFPILLETYRECLRDVFDVRGLEQILRDVEQRAIRVVPAETRSASPFAASLLFNYVGQFIYDGDAPLAERRAATLALDHAQLRELLGDAELRELLDPDAVEAVVAEVQRLAPHGAVKTADGVHQLLLQLGDLDIEELRARCESRSAAEEQLEVWLEQLHAARRIAPVRIAGQARWIAAEDAARYRDALGIVPPSGLPFAFLEPVREPLLDLVSRYARTHGPFRESEPAARWGLGVAPVREALHVLAERGRVLQGEFLRGGTGTEWCDADVLRRIKRRSLAKLRQQIEPVEPAALASFVVQWQSIAQPRRGLDGLLDVIQQLQGYVVPASVLERDVLPKRVLDFQPSQLDELCAAGEVVWQGCGSTGQADGRVALYLTDHYRLLARPMEPLDGSLAQPIRDLLRERGAQFFDDLVRGIGGYPNDLLGTLWQMVWAGELTNDTLKPLRSLQESARGASRRGRVRPARFRSRRTSLLPGSEGRWSLLDRERSSHAGATPSATQRQAALATQLIERYGVVTRELVTSEGVPGGFAGLYPVFRAMEESGRVRRGYFVAGLGAAQFAAPGADDRLRAAAATVEEPPPAYVLAACDPANPFGTLLRWPPCAENALRPTRSAGARVVLVGGQLLGFWSRNGDQLTTFFHSEPGERRRGATQLVRALVEHQQGRPIYITSVDGVATAESILADALRQAHFIPTPRGFLLRHRAG